ncbi:MAG: hypothetical protein AAFP26_10630 [Planctomycetota bacterium]
MSKIVTAIATVACAGIASAQQLPGIGDGQETSWDAALSSGMISPTDQMTNAAMNFYQGQVDGSSMASGYAAVMPLLDAGVLVSDGQREFDSLVMSWDVFPDQDIIAVAQWQWNIAGPGRSGVDLTDLKLDFSVYAPQGVWDVSMELIDMNGNARYWAKIGPTGGWNEYEICLDDPMGQDPFNSFFEDPGFDITQVASIRFDESGIWSMPFDLSNPAGQNTFAWNAWNHVRITPTPGGVVLLAAAGLVAGRRRRA